MTRLLDALRPHPHRGDIIAMGVLPFTVAVVLADLRMDAAWGDVVHVLFVYACAAFVHAMAMLAPLERDEGPRAYHSLLLVCGLALAALAIVRLGQLLGADDLINNAGALTWELTLFAGYALAGAYAKRSAVCTLLAAIALGGALLALCDLIFDFDGPTAFRWWLLVPMTFFALRSLGLRERHPRHAVALVEAAGVAVVAEGALLTSRLVISGGGGGHAPWGWQLVVIAGSIGLIAYAAAEQENGPAYLGALGLGLFVVSAAGDDSLLGWPLALALMSLLGLGLGLRPRRELPPPPDAGEPHAETVPLDRP